MFADLKELLEYYNGLRSECTSNDAYDNAYFDGVEDVIDAIRELMGE